MGNVRMRAEMIDYGATNVKKALDDLDVSDLLTLNARMDKIDAWKDTVEETELTGNPVIFNNALALPARSLITEINALQDLHGYDKPWAGGADKNLLPDTYTAQAASVFGLTVTKVDNGLRFVGVPTWNTQTSQFRAASSSNIATLYNDGASPACFLKVSNQYINIDSCRVDGNDIIVVANTTATTTNIDFTLEFMMYKGTAPTAFRPYSNICPISGRDSVVVTRSDGDEISEDFTIQLGTTVYGGEVNWDTGVMTVTHAIVTFNGGDSESWLGNSGWSESCFSLLNALPSDAKIFTGYASITTAVSNLGEAKTPSSLANSTAFDIGFGQGGGVGRDLFVNFGENYNTVAKLKTYLASNNLQICYELAIPTTIQLTPTQLEMLKGYNRVTIEDGTITITAYTGAAWGGDET